MEDSDMTKRIYMTAAELGISPDTRAWMIRVRNRLITMQPQQPVRFMGLKFEFDMGTVSRKDECGTAGCILGMALILQPKWPQRHSEDARMLRRMFYPCLYGRTEAAHRRQYDGKLDSITPRMAAGMLTRYLKTGIIRFAGCEPEMLWGN